jgi:hypothetical protein
MESRPSRELTILLDLLIEVVDINSVVGASLGNCHGWERLRLGLKKKKR